MNFTMTSIIGYTRVPFNPTCSIAPVKRIHSFRNHPPSVTSHNGNNHCHTSMKDENGCCTNSKPVFHRMFSREAVQSNGIIELIGDKKGAPSANDSKVTINIINSNRPIIKTQQQKKKQQSDLHKDYSIYLRIEMNGQHDYDDCCITSSVQQEDATRSYSNIQRLMDSITKIAYKKLIQFADIIELLKRLQTYQNQYHFLTCFDKQNKQIMIYFPDNLSKRVDQIQSWLKTTVGIDIGLHKDWKLLLSNTVVVSHHDKVDNEEEERAFDGKSYFNDIYKFINQVDALIESNELFSHKKEPIM
ncbi:MAG: hypothetical protein EXX96DRAFT_589945 [Benjaminiella poitrasii]|nr:MAG: hypothetical protein EXX96DRAFT_589945 [Benjaminiella poitrasii]